MRTKALLISSFTFFLCNFAYAAETLNADKVKELLSNKTHFGEHKKLGAIKTFWSSDGTVKSFSDKKDRTGKWHVKDNGKRCVTWSHRKNKEFCRHYEKDGDTYYIVHPRKGRVATISKVVEGDATK